jgi:hypothetical protein
MPRNIALQYGDVATHNRRERHDCLETASRRAISCPEVFESIA